MPSPPKRAILLRGIVAAVLAVALNAAIVAVARAVGIAPGFEPIAYPPVIFLTVLGVLTATAVFALLTRLVQQPGQTFTRLAAVVLVLSFVPDFLLLRADPAATVLGVVVLMVMHVVAAVVAVGLLVPWRR